MPNGDDPQWLTLCRAIRDYCLKRWKAEPRSVSFKLVSGAKIQLPVEQTEQHEAQLNLLDPEQEEAARWDRGPLPKYAFDFQRVYWPGLGEFWFIGRCQQLVLRQLWEAWEKGLHEVPQHVLLKNAKSDGTRLGDLFRRGDAWGTLIVRGAIPGNYRLAPLLEAAERAAQSHGEKAG
jgi:hypothetical protein